MLTRSKAFIIQFIDFFYFPIFHKLMSVQTFRYAACGGGNALLSLILFFLSYTFIFKEEVISVGFLSMTRYIAAFFFALAFSFPIGFILNKYVVFQTSQLKGRVQLVRYGLVAGLSILGNYLLLHFFAGTCGFWATPSQALTTVILAAASYFAQNYFTFGTRSK